MCLCCCSYWRAASETSALGGIVKLKRACSAAYPISAARKRRFGWNWIGHPGWLKLCVELNCAPNQNTFCYRWKKTDSWFVFPTDFKRNLESKWWPYDEKHVSFIWFSSNNQHAALWTLSIPTQWKKSRYLEVFNFSTNQLLWKQRTLTIFWRDVGFRCKNASSETNARWKKE